MPLADPGLVTATVATRLGLTPDPECLRLRDTCERLFAALGMVAREAKALEPLGVPFSRQLCLPIENR